MATETNFKYVVYYLVYLTYISLTFSLLGVFRFSSNFLDAFYIFVIVTFKVLGRTYHKHTIKNLHVVQVVEHLPSWHKALSSNPRTRKIKKLGHMLCRHT
jgi:hypothetical protein